MPGQDSATADRIAARNVTSGNVSKSPFGPADQIGMLNLITADISQSIMRRADVRAMIDLSVDLFPGMPTWTVGGEPPFQISMAHTPRGSAVDDPVHVGRGQNEHISWSADSVSMFTHSGTHIDALNHFGYDGRIWNGFSADEHLGSTHWQVCGVDAFPPIIGRGILLDVAGLHGVDVLPDSYGIGTDDVRGAIARQGVDLQVADIVLVRTGRGSVWPDADRYLLREPGLNVEGATVLAEAGASAIGSDNIALEALPAGNPENWTPVHTYLLAECGVPIIEVIDLERLAAEKLYTFGFFGSSIKIRGGTGGPMRAMAMPLLDN